MWQGEECAGDGGAERELALETSTGRVPGVFWRPSDAGRPALVLLGHGGSGSKRSERIVDLARWLTREAGVAALAIDGPYHGDRVTAPMPASVYQSLVAREGMGVVVERMTAQWLAVIDALGEQGLADPQRIGYVGMSMGARFGLPLAAELGDRLRCLVIGKFGLEQRPDMDPGLLDHALFSRAARRIAAPTLFHLQWDDEIFSRRGQLELFDLLGSADKRLIGFTGAHADTPADAIAAWRTFAAARLDRG